MKLRRAYKISHPNGKPAGWGYCPKWVRASKRAGLILTPFRVLRASDACDSGTCHH